MTGGLPGQQELRAVLGRFATGVVVVSAAGALPHGMTCNAFTSVSLDPPLVLVCVARTARMHRVLRQARAFGVSVLGSDQDQTARYFASSRRPVGPAQFEAVGWTAGPRTGAPLLAGALASLECEVTAEYPGGDHTIFLAGVLAAAAGPGEPLLFSGGRLGPPRPAAAAVPAGKPR